MYIVMSSGNNGEMTKGFFSFGIESTKGFDPRQSQIVLFSMVWLHVVEACLIKTQRRWLLLGRKLESRVIGSRPPRWDNGLIFTLS